jgi:hypothetical protein
MTGSEPGGAGRQHSLAVPDFPNYIDISAVRNRTYQEHKDILVQEFASIEQRFIGPWLPVKAAAYACLAVGVLIASSAAPRAFIYFQF